VLMNDPTTVDPFTIALPGQFPPPGVANLAHNIWDGPDGRLDIIPSTLDLMYVALGNPNRSLEIIKRRFEHFIVECKRKYDIVIIDCHPAGSVFTQTSLSTSDHVLIPVRPQNYAVRGLGLMKRFVDGRGPQASPIVPHILFNSVPSGGRTTVETQVRAAREFAPLCLRNTLRYWTHLTKPTEGRDFVWRRRVAYHRRALQNLREVFTEVLQRVGV